MQNPSITFAILSETGEVAERVLASAVNIGSVYVLHPPRVKRQNSPGVEYLPALPSIPAALNHITTLAGDYLAVMPDNVLVDRKLPSLLASAPDNAALIYADYDESCNGQITAKLTYEGPEDITERAELGSLLIYKNSALRTIGGWNDDLKYAFDYDLRLRLREKYADYRIATPSYTMFTEPPANRTADKLFFPGKGKYGGFSYLFMDKAEEAEIEAVFFGCLDRRGAYLAGESLPMPPEGKTSPLISVITPVFNREKFIGQAIESVIGGKFTDFEYIIIDNGSTDRTKEVVRQYAAKDSRIRLIENYINRIAYSLNLGLKNARGKYISQLDSDDLYTADTLQSMTDFMEATGCGLGISYYSLIDAEGSDLPEFGVIKHLEYSRNNILRVDGAGAARMWRKSAMLELGGFDSEDLMDYGEDYDLILKLGEKYLVGRVHEVLYKYRRHPDNSDILRDPMFKLWNKNLARERALIRRRRMNEG